MSKYKDIFFTSAMISFPIYLYSCVHLIKTENEIDDLTLNPIIEDDGQEESSLLDLNNKLSYYKKIFCGSSISYFISAFFYKMIKH